MTDKPKETVEVDPIDEKYSFVDDNVDTHETK